MTQMTFISVETFKAETGTTGAIDFLISKDKKLFASAKGKNYKAQGTLDPKKPIRFMYSEAEGFDSGCFVNVTPLKAKFSL